MSTKINEVTIKGKVSDDNQKNSEIKGGASINKEAIIKECIEQVKAYLKYEHGR